ncbi:MAG: ferrochelatase [Gaiellales bacterium]
MNTAATSSASASVTAKPRTGVLVMAYGTPASMDELEAYYTHIRHGRPPTPEALQDLRERYESIGSSPLTEITRAQLNGIAEHLPPDTPIALGCKHVAPFIEDGVEELLAAGCDQIVGLVLAPHFSTMSIGQYMGRAAEQAGDRATILPIESWAREEGYIELLAGFISDELDAMRAKHPELAPDEIQVLITAHSLPERILKVGDPYIEELTATATLLAERLDLPRWQIAWQSEGNTPDPWIGPDVLDAMPKHVDEGAKAVIVCSAGFVADHLEVLYDLDVEAADKARELGIPFARTAAPNAREDFCRMLAGVVRRTMPGVPA